MLFLFLFFKVLLLAMKDMNVAKLTASDLPLFNGITSDLFPGVDVPVLDYSIVRIHCFASCKSLCFCLCQNNLSVLQCIRVYYDLLLGTLVGDVSLFFFLICR